MASTIQVANEMNSTTSRITKEGRKITYQLKVIQPPERARACGSGAKSSADRRPVDPPPIVELRVFDDNDDITFGYNANFFLFATLENARTIAQGRVPQSQATFPVLTGTPVAGMAYLDRPAPAGYFIFPDLSVRHEGKYRLAFSLYEELKEPKDADKDESPAAQTTNPGAPNSSHVSYRLEVKSTPFTVFSAKKFPGLTESTSLSRIVAEQGCRVRIRRDVRMRRRDNKHSKDWDDYDDENAYERAKRASATPDAYGQAAMGTPHPGLDGIEHHRRMSNASQASLHPSHRSSASDMHAAYQAQSYGQPPIAPQTPQQTYPQQMPYGQPSYSHPNSYAPQPAPMQPPQPQYHPPQSQYQPQSVPVQSNYNGYMPNQPFASPQHYEHPSSRHDSFTYDHQAQEQYRRQTMPQLQSQPQAPFHGHQGSIGGLDAYSRPPSVAQAPRPSMPTAGPPSMTGNALPPLQTKFPMPSDKIEPNSPASAMPIAMSASVGPPVMPNLSNQYPATPQSAHPTAAVGKRSFGQSFDTKHIQQPLRQGARPNGTDGTSPGHGLYDGTYDEISDSESSEDLMYKRADGTQSHRKLPAAQ
ncbi:hypothetical protein EV356DRAFT_440647 [Viridothelium virens]|uniref:Velvet domain-containing protein n=1 Tax=Viridothelium virens TaxID=1048519 RepID=A0A6A6HKX3_VIRVR|nr:hypothetical protein EV356DRAFT_440647 [Viridothelium virens]